ncbi:MAG TPA: class I SAM-dependent methyltransferase, partial [Caulobacter sp.]|nr:class I SAM-dependent methyltransferase [Caulobacter sp.]
IGSGTGLLAMMAARAGAAAVVTCEMNPAVADAATDIVALNGYADRVRVIAKRSTDLDPDADMGGRADVLVSEIVSNDLLREGALPVMEDAVARLLKPGGRMIPESGRIRVALAHWAGLDRRRMSLVAGFDMTPFNRLARRPERLEVGDPELALRGPAADLFEFDFSSGGPYRPGRATVNLVADGQAINGVAQWISLRMDAAGDYENQPAAGASSCWACLFHPFERELRPLAGTAMSIHGAHTRQALRIWSGGTA